MGMATNPTHRQMFVGWHLPTFPFNYRPSLHQFYQITVVTAAPATHFRLKVFRPKFVGEMRESIIEDETKSIVIMALLSLSTHHRHLFSLKQFRI